MNRYFLKHLPHKNHGQLYMHLVSRRLYQDFFMRQFIGGIDYTLSADNFDGLVLINFTTNNPSIQPTPSLAPFYDQEITYALGQATCANQRQATAQLAQLSEIMQDYQKIPWQNLTDPQLTNPIQQGAWSLASPALNFFRQFSQDFQTFDIFITLKHLASSKKPLACELLHALSESIFALLYAGNHTPPCHQTAIFWAEYQYEKNSNLVGTQQQFRFVSSDLNPQKLTNLLRDHLDILASQNFHQRLLTQLQQNQAKLSPAELFKASGHLVGEKYWQTIASQDLIEIFAAIKQNLSVEIAEM